MNSQVQNVVMESRIVIVIFVLYCECAMSFHVFSWFYSLISMFCLNVECVHGCEGFTHPWEIREALGEGISWVQHCS